MLVGEVIEGVIAYCGNLAFDTGLPIDPATTRDRVTYGEDRLGVECTGIVTCIWPTVDVIRRARELGANLIISHEALFWNHGDRRDVLAHNTAFQAKLRLLDEWGGTVWRCHDYIHAGIPLADGTRADGIFYGFAESSDGPAFAWVTRFRCLDYELPAAMTARELGATHREEAWAWRYPACWRCCGARASCSRSHACPRVPEHDTAEIKPHGLEGRGRARDHGIHRLHHERVCETPQCSDREVRHYRGTLQPRGAGNASTLVRWLPLALGCRLSSRGLCASWATRTSTCCPPERPVPAAQAGACILKKAEVLFRQVSTSSSNVARGRPALSSCLHQSIVAETVSVALIVREDKLLCLSIAAPSLFAIYLADS